MKGGLIWEKDLAQRSSLPPNVSLVQHSVLPEDPFDPNVCVDVSVFQL